MTKLIGISDEMLDTIFEEMVPINFIENIKDLSKHFAKKNIIEKAKEEAK